MNDQHESDDPQKTDGFAEPAAEESADISRLHVDGKEIILIGTAHISAKSVETVVSTIEAEQPDSVCVELDEQRFKALREETSWQDLDLKQVIRNKQTTFLVARLALMAFQKKMSLYTGVKPGQEMLEATIAAERCGASVELVDRDIRTTLLRAWRNTPFLKRSSVAALLVMGMFQRTEVDEEDLEELRDTHNISEILDELGDALPSVKSVLVDERDEYMAQRIRLAPGPKVVVVIGAAHKPGIIRHLTGQASHSVEELDDVPERGFVSKLLPWILPAIVIGLFVAGFFFGDPENFKRAALAWVLSNGIFASLGALLALAHPITIIVAFIAAPLTSLNPTVGAGMVTAFVQTFIAAPTVRDMERVGDDIVEWKGFWTNRLSRILLVFVFSNLGSSLGTFISFKWLKDLV
jgi:pheromone shutdown-related protein TraB